MSDLIIYCINLKHRLDRWNRFESQEALVELKSEHTFKRFEGVNGKEIDVQNDSRVSTRTKRNIRDNIRRSHEELDTVGGVGCYLSHYNIWKKFVEMDKEEYCLIFEDDVYLHPAFAKMFKITFEEFKKENVADVWWLKNPNNFYSNKDDVPAYSVPENFDGRWIYDVCSTAPGYVISKHAAKMLIASAFPIEMHVDLYICLLRDMKKIRTVYNRDTNVGVYSVTLYDTDIQSDRSCKICDIPKNFHTKGNILISLPHLCFGIAAILTLYLLGKKR
jgi:GR25 family glycosyltransferase involved in LPS biosynthesis